MCAAVAKNGTEDPVVSRISKKLSGRGEKLDQTSSTGRKGEEAGGQSPVCTPHMPGVRSIVATAPPDE